MKYSADWGFNKLKKLLIGIWLFCPVVLFAQGTPVFDDLKQNFEENQVFVASFIHEYNDTFTGEQQITEGTIWVGKDQYKMRSGDNVMLVDGMISQVYDSAKRRVIISDYVEEEDDFAPSRMLQGVDDSYEVNEEKVSNQQTKIHLISDDPFAVFMSVVILVSETGVPLQIEATDQVENELITYFRNGRFVPETPETFQFEHPEGVERIDLRQDS